MNTHAYPITVDGLLDTSIQSVVDTYPYVFISRNTSNKLDEIRTTLTLITQEITSALPEFSSNSRSNSYTALRYIETFTTVPILFGHVIMLSIKYSTIFHPRLLSSLEEIYLGVIPHSTIPTHHLAYLVIHLEKGITLHIAIETSVNKHHRFQLFVEDNANDLWTLLHKRYDAKCIELVS